MPNLMDYHLHTAVTIDGNMTELEACERAVEMGIKEIAFTNHVMLNQADYMISPSAFRNHWDMIQQCQDRFPHLVIRLGIEMDYYPNRENDILEKIQNYESLIGRPFDFILGSIHDIHGGFFSNRIQAVPFFQTRDIVSIYNEYYELATQAVQSHLFDLMAHPDLIKKFTHELTPIVPYESFQIALESFIDALIRCGIGIEINTKGLKLPVNEPYPSIEFLQRYLSMGKTLGIDPIITIGSDAHKVNDLGFGIEAMISTLKGYQVKKLACFERRQILPFPISD